MTETTSYLEGIVKRTKSLHAKFEQRSKTKKMKAAIGTMLCSRLELRIRSGDMRRTQS